MLLLACAAAPVLGAYAAAPSAAIGGSCQAQLATAAPDADSSGIDADTPADACTFEICTEDYETCTGGGAPLSTLQLVLSDEFTAPNQSFAAGAGNPRWTAGNMWYSGTADWEAYKPEQVTTEGGAAVLTIERLPEGQPATGLSQRGQFDRNVVWTKKDLQYKSGWLDSWNKMCFTGGYVEARVQLPGDPGIAGFWPAFWLMGNLGRAGYMTSTDGMWPYTYDHCGGDAVGREFGDQGPIPQRFSACPDPKGVNRTLWGLLPGQGRGAPEIDIIEVKSGKGKSSGGNQPRYPFTLLPLHVAPLIPENTFWTETDADGNTVPGPGQYIPQQDQFWTDLEFWKGPFATNQQDRPGDKVRDVMGAYAQLDESFWTDYHTFGLLWQPGEYIRWYIDGTFVYELNKEALRAQSNGSYTVPERLIPVEPMYVIMNLALSDSFGTVKEEDLPYPSQFKIDYVRVYQNPDNVSTTCDPGDHPTEQYIACNRDLYLISEEEQALVTATCLGAPSCASEANMDYTGADLKTPEGLSLRYNSTTPRQCCEACQKNAACGAYTWAQDYDGTWYCYLKDRSGSFTRTPKEGPISGVVYDAGATVPRGPTNSSSTGGLPASTPNSIPGAIPVGSASGTSRLLGAGVGLAAAAAAAVLVL
ncbi:hypothetical protein ABPG77_007483 [Micractinium sp. CCAP 211/92]